MKFVVFATLLLTVHAHFYIKEFKPADGHGVKVVSRASVDDPVTFKYEDKEIFTIALKNTVLIMTMPKTGIVKGSVRVELFVANWQGEHFEKEWDVQSKFTAKLKRYWGKKLKLTLAVYIRVNEGIVECFKIPLEEYDNPLSNTHFGFRFNMQDYFLSSVTINKSPKLSIKGDELKLKGTVDEAKLFEADGTAVPWLPKSILEKDNVKKVKLNSENKLLQLEVKQTLNGPRGQSAEEAKKYLIEVGYQAKK